MHTPPSPPVHDPRLEPFDEANRRLAELAGAREGRETPRHDRYDLVVIGGGTAGLVSSAIAAELEARTLLVERSLLGGDCLVAGCVPSKALIRCARAADAARSLDRFGVHVGGPPRVDFAEVMQRLRDRRARIAEHDSAAEFERRGVEVVFGDARFADARHVEVNGSRVRFARAILATGSRARRLDLPGLEPGEQLTNETIFGLTELPRSLAVVGGGPLGCELAQAFARLGSRVTLIERSDALMGPEDAEATRAIHAALESDGVRVLTGAEVAGAEREVERRVLRVSTPAGEERVPADRVLVGVGREPIVGGLGLEAAGVRFSDRGIDVDDRLRTSNRRVYAAGDCCLRARFTHTADASARIAVRNALFLGRGRASAMVIPRCTYTSPEVASVGDTSGDGAETVRIPMADVDRAILDGDDTGWLKIYHRGGRIRGAVLVADHAGDMISIVTAAMVAGASLPDLSGTIFPYPTAGEIVRKAGDAQQLQSLGPLTRHAARFAVWLTRRLA